MEPVYRSVVVAAGAVSVVKRWKTIATGLEHIPSDGGVVLATNHISYLDFAFIGRAVFKTGRRVRILGKQEIYDHGIAGYFMRKAKHIPVDRSGDPSRALDQAVVAAQEGEVILIYPETTISRSFVPMPGKSGAVRIALSADVPLIPMAVWGCHRLMTKGRKRELTGGVLTTLVIDSPMVMPDAVDPSAITEKLMSRITELVDGLALSYPQQPDDPGSAWWIPAHLGGAAPTPLEAAVIAAQGSSST